MTDFILACDCGDTKAYALDAYHIMGDRHRNPAVFNIHEGYKLLDRLDRDSNVYSYVTSLLNKKGRFAYYIAYDGVGNVTRHWDLLTGKNVLNGGAQ